MPKYRIDDEVMFVSSGTEKIGRVALIVPANKKLADMPEFITLYNASKSTGRRYMQSPTRPHESYIVLVGGKQIYYPIVAVLELRKSASAAQEAALPQSAAQTVAWE